MFSIQELAVFAIGHSARDTFAMLHQHEIYYPSQKHLQ